MIVDSAIYVDGKRTAEPPSLQETYEACRQRRGLAWIGLYRTTEEEFSSVAKEFGLHELAVEDAVKAHQRPKLERYGDTRFLVLRPARYMDESETVEFGEIEVFVGPSFVITVQHRGRFGLAEMRRSLEARPDILQRGPLAIVHAIADLVVDGYAPVLGGVQNDIDEIEDEVFGGSPQVSQRIYKLHREVIAFERAAKPLPSVLAELMRDVVLDSDEHVYLRDVQDHAIRVVEEVSEFRALLQNILGVTLTLETKALSEVSNKQNDQVKSISAWAAILFAPTLVGTIYGMNFRHMPELKWLLGYPFALGLMVLVSLVLYLVFKRRGWI